MISSTFQTNTFTDGMNCDTDVTMLSDKQYRYAENIRVVTNDGGTTGVLQNIEGVKKYIGNIPINETIIGTTTINDIAIVVTKMQNGYNKVYRITEFDTNTPKQDVILKGDLKLCQDLEKTPNISIVGNYETDTNIKVYFTDGNSAIKVLNVIDNKYAAGTNFVDGQGNINNPLVLDITPGASLPPFKLTNLSIGNMPSGVVQYCYQLFNLHNSESTLSSLSELIHLTQSSTNQSSQKYEGAYPNTSSGKACSIEAPFISTDFEKCRIISIRYATNNSIPQILIVDEIDLVPGQTYIKYIDTGNSFMGQITVEEFNTLTGYQFIASSISKMSNRLFASDIKEDTWNPGFYDARAYRANGVGQVYLQSSSGTQNITFPNITTADLSTVPTQHDCINIYNSIEYSDSSDANRYIYGKTGKLGGYGINIEYNFTTVPIELSEVQSEFRLDNNCSMNVMSKSMSSILLTNVGLGTSTNIELGDSSTHTRIPNYADPQISSKFKGYQRDEIYRFGIVFFNNKNLPSPVYWIADIKMPHADQVPPFVYKNNQLIGQALGVNFTVKNAPADAMAYEIVRCDRTESDRSVIMQCIGSNLYEYRISETGSYVGYGESMATSLEMRPSYFLNFGTDNLMSSTRGANTTNGDDWTYFYRKTAPYPVYVADYLRLVSPEICVAKENTEKHFKDSAYLDFIGVYASPIATNPTNQDNLPDGQYTSVFAQSDKALQYDGSIKTVIKNQNYIRIKDDKLCFELQCKDTGGKAISYNANIAKYYYPLYKNTVGQISKLPIIDAKYPMDIPYNSYSSVSAYRTSIGQRTYTNYGMANFDKSDQQCTTGAAGPCVIVQLHGLGATLPRFTSLGDSNLNSMDVFNAVPVFNIKRNISASYGGNTYTSRQNSVYISTNSYANLILDNAAVHNLYTYGGDTFLNVLDYSQNFTFQANDEKRDTYQKRFIGAYIPFESSINMNLFNGQMIHRTHTSDNYADAHLQLDITQKGNYHAQDRPYYVYNSVYSSQSGSKKYVPNSIYAEDDLRMFNRIMSSQAKTSNEIFDNWTSFKIADYLDVDNQYGAITNIRTFKDKLFYWQDTALGVAAVNERALISDGNIGQLTLGTGGVLSRFDYVTTTNGSSIVNDRSIVNSDTTLYWYDFDKNEICSYNGNVTQLSKERQVQSYLNELFSGKRDVTLSLYDKKYNEVWFKFYDKSLIFNEQLGRFTSFYTFNPDWSLQFSDKSVAIKDNELYVINTLDTDGLGTVDKKSKIQFVVNKDTQYTKVFDNVRLSGEFRDQNNTLLTSDAIEYMKFGTKHQTSTNIEPVIDYREDSYRFAIGRQDVSNEEGSLSHPSRMRGKYLVCDYTLDANGEHTFKIPYITTTYRYSLI